MSRNETTIEQYAEFLNAVAATDTYGLWNSSMASDANIAGITRSGTSGSYTYSVTGSGLRPITYVSWFDAARFANWIHNGQQSGAGAALTAETGAYTLNGATSGIISKNVGATVWIPTEDEWFKAAYYDPTQLSGSGGYWLHANQSNSMTTNTIGDLGAANFRDPDYAKDQNSLPSLLTDAGVYGENSQSYYGTNDQAGNVYEWTDAVVSGTSRVTRGGYYVSLESDLRSSNRITPSPTSQNGAIGFRLASIPEPSAALLTLLSTAFPLLSRRRRA